MAMLGGVEHDEWLRECSRIPRVERRIPLPILLTKTHDDDVCVLKEGAGTDGIELCTLVVMPELVLFLAENRHTAIIGRRMVRDRSRVRDVEARVRGDLVDPLTPIAVDLAGQVHIPGLTHVFSP